MEHGVELLFGSCDCHLSVPNRNQKLQLKEKWVTRYIFFVYVMAVFTAHQHSLLCIALY